MTDAARRAAYSDPLTADEREWYEERAAIREYDGGMARLDAERAARGDILARRLEALRPDQPALGL